jgi:hypothetical protein
MAQGDGFIKNIVGDGTNAAAGKVAMQKALEQRPCYLCRSWEKDERRLVRHIRSAKLTLMPDGSFESPAQKDRDGKPMKLHVDRCGYCKRDGIVTEDEATCLQWTQVSRREDMRARLSLRDRIHASRR